MIYGLLNLLPTTITLETSVPFDDESMTKKFGSHLDSHSKNPDAVMQKGDFILAGKEVISRNVPTRVENIDAVMAGVLGNNLSLLDVVRMLLYINSERNRLHLRDVVYEKLFSSIPGHYAICLSQSGDYSRFIFLLRNIQLFMLGLNNEEETYLVWSNERNLEERMRATYGGRFFYYRFPVISYGSLVIQTKHLSSRILRWKKESKDRLRIFAALENHLYRRHHE